MITTIQIHEKIKQRLDDLKQERESYEDVIVGLIEKIEKQKKSQTSILIQGYKEMSKESLKVTKEWSFTDKDWD